MYKNLLLTITFACLTLSAFSQSRGTRNSYGARSSDRGECPKIYLGVSTGINNNVGLIGGSIEVAPIDRFSLNTGVGVSSWGYKYFGEFRFYFTSDNCHRSWALGAGVTHNTGLSNFEWTTETGWGEEEVVLDLKPKTNAFFSFYKFYNMGRKHNRFYFNLGYSIALSNTEIKQKSGPAISEDTENVMNFISPGGIIIGTGIYFGLGNGF